MIYKKLLIVLIALIIIYFVFNLVPGFDTSEKLGTGLNEPEPPLTGGIIIDAEDFTGVPFDSIRGSG